MSRHSLWLDEASPIRQEVIHDGLLLLKIRVDLSAKIILLQELPSE